MSKRPSPSSISLDNLRRGFEGPSVTVDGIKFFSDRFYLNHVQGVDGPFSPPETASSTACTCGSQQAPPLFSRERLLKSLSLKAVILGTFTMDPRWLGNEFPEIFGPDATIPTLVLHGDKVIKRLKMVRQNAATKKSGDDDDDSISELENSQPVVIQGVDPEPHRRESPSSRAGIPLVEFPANRLIDDETLSTSGGGTNSLETQAPPPQPEGQAPDFVTCAHRDEIPCAGAGARPTKMSPDPNHPSWKTLFQNQDFGKHCHFTFVQSNWKTTGDAASRGVSKEKTITKLQAKRGVYHPKFMILFEKSGSVVVVVSTANLVRTKTVEGSWVQRFLPNKRKASPAGPTQRSPRRGNDFGPVLQDFLQKLDESAIPGDTKTCSFLEEHLSFELAEFANSFLFHKAQVHLVPVIPGDFPVKSQAYGRLRVQAILQQAREQNVLVEHKKDRLLVQPTSFGGNWKQQEMADMTRSYLSLDKTTEGYWDDESILRRMNVLWPSRTFLENIRRTPDKHLCMGEVEDFPMKDENDDGGVVFMSSQSFNSCEMPCIARMSRLQWSDPPQRRTMLVPHFKSICRVVRKPACLTSKYGFENAAASHYFSWFLMTSACLSLGAQGQRDRFSVSSKNTIRFANFELGILFTSRVEKTSKVLYTFQPQKCSCRSLHPKQKVIHLPVPFSLQVDPYFATNKDGEEECFMQETPFLHQVQAGTRCVGNMMMTPYGIREAKRQKLANL